MSAVTVAGLLLIAVPLGFNGAFALLAARFDYPMVTAPFALQAKAGASNSSPLLSAMRATTRARASAAHGSASENNLLGPGQPVQ
jgi:hypothetical protein